MIDAFLTLTRLDRESVERVIGLPLFSLDEKNPFFTKWYGLIQGLGEETEIELRCPGPKAEMKDGMVILELRSGLTVTYDEVHARFGQEEEMGRSPDPMGSHPIYYMYNIKGARLSFGFREPARETRDTWPGILVSVIIDRTGC